MKTQKIGVILLALLLTAMAIVPLVSAANNYSKEKFNLVESNYIPIDVAHKNALMTLQEFISSGSLDAKWNGATLTRNRL